MSDIVTAIEIVWQVRPPFDMILRVYAAGLHLINCNVKFRGGDLTSFGGAKYEPAVRILCDDGNILQNLAAQLGSFGCCFHIGCKENCVISSVKYTDSVGQICSQLSSGYEACTEKNRKAYLLFYLNALRFLCQPLAELVNSERKQLVSENEDAFVTNRLCVIQDIFHQFADIFLSCQRYVNCRFLLLCLCFFFFFSLSLLECHAICLTNSPECI